MNDLILLQRCGRCTMSIQACSSWLNINGNLTSELLPVDAVLVLRHLVLLPWLPCAQLLALASPRLVQDDLIA